MTTELRKDFLASLATLMLTDDALRRDGEAAMVGGKPAVVIVALSRHEPLLRELLGVDQGSKGLSLPKLTIRSTQKYIAAVAKAVELGQLAKGDANSLLYAAQMLLAAHRYQLDITPPDQGGTPAKRLGFVQAFADDAWHGTDKKTVRKFRSTNDLGGETCLQR